MSQCWNRSHRNRPNFIEVIEKLLNDTNEHFLEVCYYTKYKSQLKKRSSSTSIHDDLSMPLQQISNTVNIEEDFNDSYDDSAVHFFPLSRTIAIPENTDTVIAQFDEENYDIDQIDEYTNADHLLRDISIDSHTIRHLNNGNSNSNTNTNCYNNSKGNSVQSSDGSKGSKISSTTSNGSIANGHAVHCKTTTC